MSTALETTIGTEVNESVFAELAKRYAANKALVAALAKVNDREQAFIDALQVIADLEHVAENGVRYTPNSSFGFGPNTSATIANSILGRGMTPAKMRSAFAKFGK